MSLTSLALPENAWRKLPGGILAYSVLFIAGPYVVLAIYSVLPDTRKHFAEARARALEG